MWSPWTGNILLNWASMTNFAHVAYTMIHCLGFEKAIERSRWLDTPIEENTEEDENDEVACYTTKMLVEVPLINMFQ